MKQRTLIIYKTFAFYQMFKSFEHSLSSFVIQYQLVTVNANKMTFQND